MKNITNYKTIAITATTEIYVYQRKQEGKSKNSLKYYRIREIEKRMAKNNGDGNN